MNKKGFAISVVLYTMVILIIGILYLLLGIVRHRYNTGNDLKEHVISGINPGGPPISEVLADIVEDKFELTPPDTDGTKFLEGEEVPNYLWYSGKLWRILAINNDGSIRLVTHGCVSSVAWNSTSSTDYRTSQIRTWLNNEFYGTIYDADNLLVGTTLDYTLYDTFPTSKLASTNVINDEKIGLLTIYEYMMSGGTTTNATSKTFLNTAYYWWTASPNVNDSKIWYVGSENHAAVNNVMTNYGVRPTITLRAGVKIFEGTGEKNNPFRIVEDKPTGTNYELLNNRISGEYVNFNNRIYRIVGTEIFNGEKLTKITMADYSFNKNTIATIDFGAGYSEATFTLNYGIGLYLENWYQADSSNETYKNIYITDTYKAMIATKEEGVVWYKGPDSGGANYDYTLAKSGIPVSATIGLGRYGEMFSSQFGDGWETSYAMSWLITKSSNILVWRLNGNGGVYSYSPDNALGVRPSMYLKSDIKISSGTGMPHNPYQLSMN